MENQGGEVAAASQPAACRPWLVHYHGKGYRKQPFASDIAGPSPGIIIPGLGHNKVLSCAHGCLVLYDYKAKLLSLCNSATFDNDNRIRLPHLNHLSNYKIDSCVLLPPPLPPQGPGGGGGGHTNNNSSNWHGFTVSIFLEKLPSIMFCRVGETKWREIRYGKYLEPFVPEKIQRYAREWGRPLFFRRAVGFDGKIYAQLGAEWIGGFCYSMMSIEIVEVEVQVEVEGGAEYGLVLCTVEEPAGLSCASISPYTNVYIVESCGELFLLHFSPGAQVFELYRMSFHSMEWERMKSIKEDSTIFFIGRNYCFCCPPSGGGGGGLIYFTKRKDKRLYCYNMEDGSILMSSPRLLLFP